MPELKNQQFRPQFNKELNIESIISAPLVAASKANVVMATGQTRFLLDYCFSKQDGNEIYKPVMIDMYMEKTEIDHDKESTDPNYFKITKLKFRLPLLTLVSLNSLAIDEVAIDFNMEITSVTSYESAHGIIDKQAQLNGKISHDPKNSHKDSNKKKSQQSNLLKVNIHAGPLPLPTGVISVIDLYTKAIHPLPFDEKEKRKKKKTKK